MEFKRILESIVAIFIGLFVFGQLTSVIETPIYLLLFSWLKIESTQLMWYLLILYGFAKFIIGIYLGFISYKRKNLAYKIFKPTRTKFIVSLIIFVCAISFSILTGPGRLEYYFISSMSHGVAIFTDLLIGIIYYYPFSALIVYIYKNKASKVYLSFKILILLLLLNPIFTSYAVYVTNISTFAMSTNSCGVRIVGFTEDSAAEESGIKVNEIIIKMDNTEINSLTDLDKFMLDYSGTPPININTQSSNYSVSPTFVENKFFLGVKLVDQICRRKI